MSGKLYEIYNSQKEYKAGQYALIQNNLYLCLSDVGRNESPLTKINSWALAIIGGDSTLTFVKGILSISTSVSGISNVIGIDSVNSSVVAGVATLNLVNDVNAPAASFYYGTDAGGIRGWFALPSGGSVLTVSVATANGFSGTSDGNPTNPTLTLTTTVTANVLKGNGTAIIAAVGDVDYQNPITLTTTGTSGVATFIADVLNIPNYGSAIPSVADLTGTSNRITLSASGVGVLNTTNIQLTVPDNAQLNIANIVNLTGNGLVRTTTGTGLLGIDTTQYLPTALTNAHIWVGDAASIAADVAVSGDLTLANTGAFTLVNSDVTANTYTVNGSNLFTVDAKGRLTSATSVTVTAVASSIVVGTTAVTSGTSGRVLFDSAGVLGEYTITGTAGSVVLSTTPTIATPSFTTGFTIGGVAASGTMPRGNGTNFVASTSTFADTYTQGALLYASAANTVTGLTIGSASQLLRVNAGATAPEWFTPTYISGLVVGTTTIASGTDKRLLFDNAGVLGEIAVGASTNILMTVGGAWTASTPSYPNTATSGKVLIGDGTNIVLSTPAFPNASASALKWMRSDGTNWIASTGKLAESAVTAGKILRSDGTDWLATTSTFADTYAVSTLLYASSANVVTGLATANTSALVTNSSGVPAYTSGGTANRVLRTDGTTVSFAQAAMATDLSDYSRIFVTTGNQTTTNATATSITDLVTATLAINSRYYFDGVISVGCNNTGGVKFAIVIPTGASMAINFFGASTAATAFLETFVSASGTLTGTAHVRINGSQFLIHVQGEIATAGTAGTAQFQFASGTAGQTSTIFQIGTNINIYKIAW